MWPVAHTLLTVSYKELITFTPRAAFLYIAAILHEQKHRHSWNSNRIYAHTDHCDSIKGAVAVTVAVDLKVDIEPFFIFIELTARKTPAYSE